MMKDRLAALGSARAVGAAAATGVARHGTKPEGRDLPSGRLQKPMPPLPRIISIWRIIFFPPPPFSIRIIFCIC